MLWLKLSQRWNDICLQKKILALILSTLVFFFSLFLYVVYNNINSLTYQSVERNAEKVFQSTKHALEGKMERIDQASMLISTNSSIENILQGEYDSIYSFYYDLKYQYDSMIAALKLTCPEITNVDIYIEEPHGNMARSTFHPLSALGQEYPQLDLGAFQSTTWLDMEDKVYLFRKIYNSYSNDNCAVVKITIRYNSLFTELVAANQNQGYCFCIRDNMSNHLFCAEPGNHEETGGVVSSILIEEQLLNNWVLSLSVPAPDIPLSSFASNRDLLILIVSFICTVLLLRFLVSRTIVKRMEALNRYVSDVVDKNFMDEIVCEDKDEIGNIIRNVNNMTMRTHQLIDRVYNSQILQKEAEIQMLQTQINPHFLYNTLSVLNWNAIKYGDMETSRIITDLSMFYREALKPSSMTTTIREEIEFIQKYISIRKLTCSHEFSMELRIPDQLLEYELPRVILQPIVENAVDHGIEKLPLGKEGLIVIEALERENEIILSVQDNGPGMDEEMIDAVLQPKTRGYGLYNVNKRIKLFFDQEYGITLSNMESRGFVVTLRFPEYVSLLCDNTHSIEGKEGI